eukprot:13972601-Ditylum_brightwellii.AAC.1
MTDKAAAALPLALHLFFCLLHQQVPICHTNVLSLRKLAAEGTLCEIIKYIGWVINTRAFTIALLQDKATKWLILLDGMINTKHASFKDLESLISRLNHVGYIIPNARHFLSRIRRVLTLLWQYHHPFSSQVIADLTLWKGFIRQAAEGILLNNVVYRAANIAVWSDTSLHGIGSYSSNGNAWCWQLPAKLVGIFTLNCLEFIAAAISLDRALSCAPQDSCYVGITDSPSVAGWLYKLSFHKDTHPEHLEIAQLVARAELRHRAV